jgi:asparagine synthase (glutamine-hydrolysing)
MCGIAGVVRRDGNPVDRDMLGAMTRMASHRGPDGEGYYTHRNLGLGHTRLAIIDLSVAADQPMQSEDRRLTIVFNGEIYNYLELREDLIQRGHRFTTKSDTEVILEAYAEWGVECVQRFNGMWAFALHDHGRNRLFCSRDRFGIKPFYYVDSGVLLAFGSEIKQLLAFLPRRKSNNDILLTFLATGLCDYSEETFFEGVTKLLPGHNLIVDLGTGAARCQRYYEPQPLDLGAATEPQLQERFLDLLTSSVKLRLRSDVPVGTSLSGGLDSSAIAALAAPRYFERSRQPFCAVTGVSIDPEIDESAHARQVVQHSGLRWLTTRPTSEDFLAAMSRVAYHQDEPTSGPSPLMQYFVMRTARENAIPVMLDGQGADELLLGYGMYIGVNARAVSRERGLLAAARLFQRSVAQDSRMAFGTALKYLVGAGMPARWYSLGKRRLRCVKFGSHSTPKVLKDYSSAAGNLFRFQRHEIENFTLPALLRYEDRNSMAFGIETRLPFLDYRLVELCLSLPLHLKVRDGWTKWILRRAMAGLVPDSIMWRKDKIGFQAPEKIWLRDQEAVVRHTILESDLIRSITDERRLTAEYSKISFRERWRLFSVAMWGREFNVGMEDNRPLEDDVLEDEAGEMSSCR